MRAGALFLAALLALPAGSRAEGDGLRLAVKGGALVPDSRLGAALLGALEGSWLVSGPGGALALGAEVSLAAPASRPRGSLLSLPRSGSTVDVTDLALTAALAWRWEPMASLRPYVSVGLALHALRAETVWLGATSVSRQLRPGLGALLGVEWAVGRGGPFLEMGWRHVAAGAGPAGTLEAGGFLATAGWRHAP